MATNREVLTVFRKKVQERNADSTYFDQDLYFELVTQGNWLMRREVAAGRIYGNTSFFRTLGCQEIVETSTIEECCPVKVNCKIYRTKEKLPKMWIDNKGPIIKSVTSVDGSTYFTVISPSVWQNKRKDPYQKMSSEKYAFIGDDYLWFPEHNPHYINILGIYTEDISNRDNCYASKDCERFMDMPFPLPDWLHAEMMGKALQQMFPTKQMPEDNQIDKNPTRKN